MVVSWQVTLDEFIDGILRCKGRQRFVEYAKDNECNEYLVSCRC